MAVRDAVATWKASARRAIMAADAAKVGTSGMPRLEGAAIDLAGLREQSRAELISALDSLRIPGAADKSGVALVLDPALSGPLGLIAEVREFREHGVGKIYHLSADPIATDCATVAIFVRPHVALMPRLAAAARELAGARKAVSIFFVPRRSLVCERILEEERVGTGVALREFRMQLIALDDDVLSLEQPCFRELYLDGDRSVLHSIAEAILALDAQFGVIPRLRGKGNCARQVLHIVTSMRRSLQAEGRLPPAADKPAEIGSVLLIDRDVDLVREHALQPRAHRRSRPTSCA